MMSHPFVSGACAGAALLAAASVAASPVQTDHVGVELVSATTALVPGRSASLGLRFVHEPHWHTYWINPGDSGLATKLSWQLPAGFHAGEIIWPAPQRFNVDGLFNFGYNGDALLPVQLDVPASAKPGWVGSQLSRNERNIPWSSTTSTRMGDGVEVWMRFIRMGRREKIEIGTPCPSRNGH